MFRYLRYIFFTFVFLVIQTQVMRLLSIKEITPDILTIWVVYIAIKEGQLKATIGGFVIGLFFDLAAGNFIGLSALSKTIAGFIGGYFYDENKASMTLANYRFVIIVLIVSLVHNTIYFIAFTRGTDIGMWKAIYQVGIATSFYTSAIAMLPMFAFSRKYIT